MSEGNREVQVCLISIKEDCRICETQNSSTAVQSVCPNALRITCPSMATVFGEKNRNIGTGSAYFYTLVWGAEAHG